ncbi:MAG: four helix bundle protein [Candidatus Curtissbacteria bacterium]|nr:four helix bundle protein [Candidatus Curtissbacteria bacterium]MDZ4210015.1 four helix bundle protein [Candidatus Curtissbacteria bacterium]
MSFRFEKFTIWQDARKFASEIYTLTKSFPKDERFGLIDQLRRAAVSVALNIAEGSDRKSDVDFRRFLRLSMGSLEEVVTALYISLDQGYISQQKFDTLYEEANILSAKINKLINNLSGKQ